MSRPGPGRGGKYIKATELAGNEGKEQRGVKRGSCERTECSEGGSTVLRATGAQSLSSDGYDDRREAGAGGLPDSSVVTEKGTQRRPWELGAVREQDRGGSPVRHQEPWCGPYEKKIEHKQKGHTLGISLLGDIPWLALGLCCLRHLRVFRPGFVLKRSLLCKH